MSVNKKENTGKLCTINSVSFHELRPRRKCTIRICRAKGKAPWYRTWAKVGCPNFHTWKNQWNMTPACYGRTFCYNCLFFPTKIWQSAVPWCFQTEWEWPVDPISPRPVVSTPSCSRSCSNKHRRHSKATDSTLNLVNPNFGMSTPTRIHIKTSLCFMSITSLITWNLQWISQSFNGFPLGPRMFTLRAILRAAARTSSTWRTSSKGPLSWPYLAAHNATSGFRRRYKSDNTSRVFWQVCIESIPINTIFSGMNIHLPAILMFTRGTRFWHTAMFVLNHKQFAVNIRELYHPSCIDD